MITVISEELVSQMIQCCRVKEAEDVIIKNN